VQEHSDLSHSLPLSLSSSVWLRASAERMDALQFVISGPEDTPFLLSGITITTLDPLTFGSVPVTVNFTTRYGTLTGQWSNAAKDKVEYNAVFRYDVCARV